MSTVLSSLPTKRWQLELTALASHHGSLTVYVCVPGEDRWGLRLRRTDGQTYQPTNQATDVQTELASERATNQRSNVSRLTAKSPSSIINSVKHHRALSGDSARPAAVGGVNFKHDPQKFPESPAKSRGPQLSQSFQISWPANWEIRPRWSSTGKFS